MGIESTNYSTDEQEVFSTLPEDSKDGQLGDEMDVWGLDGYDLLEELAGGNFENKSSYDTPSGVVDVSSAQYSNSPRNGAEIEERNGPIESAESDLGNKYSRAVLTQDKEFLSSFGIDENHPRIKMLDLP